MRSRLAFVLLVAGCGGTSVAPATATAPATSGSIPPLDVVASERTSEPDAGVEVGGGEDGREADRTAEVTTDRAGAQASPTTTDADLARQARSEAGASPEPAPATVQPQPVRAIIVAQSPAGAPPGAPVGWDGRRQFVALGLPAMTADGSTVVLLRGGGDGSNSARSLVTLSTRTGGVVREDPLYESRAGEEDTEQERMHEQQARRQIARAQRYLARREFFGLRPLDEALTLQRDGGVVEILDADGRSRFRREFVAPSPSRPAGLDEDALVAWEVEHHCDDALLDAAAWRIDGTHVLLIVRIGSTPDECWEQDEGLIVTLSP